MAGCRGSEQCESLWTKKGARLRCSNYDRLNRMINIREVRYISHVVGLDAGDLFDVHVFGFKAKAVSMAVDSLPHREGLSQCHALSFLLPKAAARGGYRY
jgi:hypothetical protein